MSFPESAGRLDNWKELLLDLFYFIFLIKLGNIYKECKLDGIGYLFAISHFLGIYMSKFELDQYLNKFSQKDLLHSIFMIIYSFGLFISILNINSTSEVFIYLLLLLYSPSLLLLFVSFILLFNYLILV